MTQRYNLSHSHVIGVVNLPSLEPHIVKLSFRDGYGSCSLKKLGCFVFFPTCQVRVVRFYVSCLLLSSSPLLLLLLNRDPRRTVFSVGPQPRPSTPSVPCRTSTTTIPAQCSLPDLNHDHPRPVFPAGPQPRVSTPKDMPHRVPEDMPEHIAEDMPGRMPEDMPDRMPEDMPDKMPEDMSDRMPEDLPITKCIDVMVGITRSKVICSID